VETRTEYTREVSIALEVIALDARMGTNDLGVRDIVVYLVSQSNQQCRIRCERLYSQIERDWIALGAAGWGGKQFHS